MPEGPSIVILKEAVQQFTGHAVISVSGNSKIGIERIKDQTVISFKSWGKHFLICFEYFTIRIHLLMFGSYRINERKERTPQLNLTFSNGEINFYSCAIKLLEGNVNLYYDWATDVMSEDWKSELAEKKLQMIPDQLICDAILDQNIFAGVGNIIKNEVLYNMHVHPESLVGKVPSDILKTVIDECSRYSFDFLQWKKNYVLRNHWLVYTKKACSRCNLPIQYKRTGLRQRRSYYCPNCQKLYL